MLFFSNNIDSKNSRKIKKRLGRILMIVKVLLQHSKQFFLWSEAAVHTLFGPDSSSFLAAWAVNMSALVAVHDRPKPKLPKLNSTIPIPTDDLLIGKRFFHNGQCAVCKQLFFSRQTANKSQNPIIFQLDIEGPTANKMNIFHCFSLHYECGCFRFTG